MSAAPRGYKYSLREPYSTPQQRGVPLPVYRRTVEQGMVIERNVTVKLRE